MRTIVIGKLVEVVNTRRKLPPRKPLLRLRFLMGDGKSVYHYIPVEPRALVNRFTYYLMQQCVGSGEAIEQLSEAITHDLLNGDFELDVEEDELELDYKTTITRRTIIDGKLAS